MTHCPTALCRRKVNNVHGKKKLPNLCMRLLIMCKTLRSILFILYSGCSVIGLDRSTPYRYVEVDKEFSSTKALLHTLFHILGRYHEHEREDRDKYVRIMEGSIIEGKLVTHNTFIPYFPQTFDHPISKLSNYLSGCYQISS